MFVLCQFFDMRCFHTLTFLSYYSFVSREVLAFYYQYAPIVDYPALSLGRSSPYFAMQASGMRKPKVVAKCCQRAPVGKSVHNSGSPPLQLHASQTQRVGDDGNGTQAHRRAREDGTEQHFEHGIEHARRDGDSQRVVEEGEEQVLTTEATQAKAERPAARRVPAQQAVWLRCSSVKDPQGVFSFVAPCHPAPCPKTALFRIFSQALLAI